MKPNVIAGRAWRLVAATYGLETLGAIRFYREVPEQVTLRQAVARCARFCRRLGRRIA